MRWIASLVAETHRILMRGGVFLYPRDTRTHKKPGRLRLLYEANPISLLIEQAGAWPAPVTGAARRRARRCTSASASSSARRRRSHASSGTTARSRRTTTPPRCSASAACSPQPRLIAATRPRLSRSSQTTPEALPCPPSIPIIAITGSSGAGTTSVTRTFENIFRREGVQAAIVEGDSFHRYDRKAMKIAMAEAEAAGQHRTSATSATRRTCSRSWRRCFATTPRRGRARRASTCTTTRRRRPYGQEPGTFTAWEPLPGERAAVL
jgi:hypothetical protein